MISLESLTKEELIDLQVSIVERLRYMQQMEARNKMEEFYFGDLVSFKDKNGNLIRGTVERFNQKSVSVKGFDGLGWRVSPQLLTKEPTAVLSVPYKKRGS
jgi:hypothetical protein